MILRTPFWICLYLTPTENQRLYNWYLLLFRLRAALRRKRQRPVGSVSGNVSKWGNMSIRRLLFQWASTIKIQLSVLTWYKEDSIIISLQIYLYSPWYSWNIAELGLNSSHSINHYTDRTTMECIILHLTICL